MLEEGLRGRDPRGIESFADHGTEAVTEVVEHRIDAVCRGPRHLRDGQGVDLEGHTVGQCGIDGRVVRVGHGDGHIAVASVFRRGRGLRARRQVREAILIEVQGIRRQGFEFVVDRGRFIEEGDQLIAARGSGVAAIVRSGDGEGAREAQATFQHRIVARAQHRGVVVRRGDGDVR